MSSVCVSVTGSKVIIRLIFLANEGIFPESNDILSSLTEGFQGVGNPKLSLVFQKLKLIFSVKRASLRQKYRYVYRKSSVSYGMKDKRLEMESQR